MKLNEKQFKEVLAESNKPILIDFYADWCGPCKIQTPIMEQVGASVGDAAVVGKINVDEERNIAREFGIMSIPTIILFKDGKVVTRLTGVTPKDRLISMIEANK
mgnify:CR=1 FL=1